MKIRTVLLGLCLAIVITVPSPVHGQTCITVHSFSGPTPMGPSTAQALPMLAPSLR